MSNKILWWVGKFIVRWSIGFLLLGWALYSLFHDSSLLRASSGITFISIAALLGAFSVSTQHEWKILNGAFQVFLVGLLSYFAPWHAGTSFGYWAVVLAVGACLLFVALVFGLLSFPVLLATSPRTGPQRELGTRIYWACFAALLVALAIGGALAYTAYSTSGSAIRMGWGPYSYALFFVGVFSGTLAILLLISA